MRIVLVNVGFMPNEAELKPSPPFGIMQMGAYLRQHGHEVHLLDWSGEELDAARRATLKDLRPDVVGIHVKISSTILRALEVSRWAREENARVIWGGPGPTTLPLEILGSAPIDAAVLGEGEETAVELLEAMEEGRKLDMVRGIAFTRGAQTIRTAPRPRIRDLDRLPLPWWEGLGDLTRYHIPMHGRKVLPLITSRGCPGNCGFCYAQTMWGGKWAALSPQRVLDNMEHVLALDPAVGGFIIIDDLFYVIPKRVQQICQGIRERGLDIVWNCEVRADLISPELLRIMRAAGCRQVLMGVETGSDRLLRMVNKRITVETIRQAARAIHDADMELYAMLVNGLPTETEEDVRATERLLRDIEPEYVEFLTYMPYPNTPLYPQALVNGFEPPRTLEGWGRMGTLDISSVEEKGIVGIPEKRYRGMARRTKQRAVMRSYVQAVKKEPFTAPSRGFKYLLHGGRKGKGGD